MWFSLSLSPLFSLFLIIVDFDVYQIGEWKERMLLVKRKEMCFLVRLTLKKKLARAERAGCCRPLLLSPQALSYFLSYVSRLHSLTNEKRCSFEKGKKGISIYLSIYLISFLSLSFSPSLSLNISLRPPPCSFYLRSAQSNP